MVEPEGRVGSPQICSQLVRSTSGPETLDLATGVCSEGSLVGDCAFTR